MNLVGRTNANKQQLMVVTELSSTPDSAASSRKSITKVRTEVLELERLLTTAGTHIRIPWFETPIDYDVRARPRIISSLTGTKDLQMVRSEAMEHACAV